MALDNESYSIHPRQCQYIDRLRTAPGIMETTKNAKSTKTETLYALCILCDFTSCTLRTTFVMSESPRETSQTGKVIIESPKTVKESPIF
jgi:hypothetical protein